MALRVGSYNVGIGTGGTIGTDGTNGTSGTNIHGGTKTLVR